MPSQIPALAQSESKAKFFFRLKLQENSADDVRLYMAMKKEATEGRKRLLEKETPSSPINETLTHCEILQIYHRASPETRAVYQLGRDTDGPEEENWIIRWMLWHVCRYRDQRNNRVRGVFATVDDRVARSQDQRCAVDSGVIPARRAEGDYGRAFSDRRVGYWDPVRNA